MHPMLSSSLNYFAWKIPSKDKSSKFLWNSSNSHLKIEKLDSTDVELGKTVASSAHKRRSWSNRVPSNEFHASLNDVV